MITILKEWGAVNPHTRIYVRPTPGQPVALTGTVEGHARKRDGTQVITSAVVSADGRIVRTLSGTTYALVGAPSEWYEQDVGPVDADAPLGAP